MIKIYKALLSLGMFFFILLSAYYIDVRFFRVDVVFYSSLEMVLVATLSSAIAFYRLPVFTVFTSFEKKQMIFIWILLGYVFAISVPTIIDRSLSFYILEKLQQRGGGIRLDKFNYVFTNEYMREHRLVDVRLTEQVASGTIAIEGDCVRLTERGYFLASLSRYFRKHLLPKQRLLMGEYTDQLTDPFRRSDVHPDYLCDR